MSKNRYKKESRLDKFFENKASVFIIAVLILIALFAASFLITTSFINKKADKENASHASESNVSDEYTDENVSIMDYLQSTTNPIPETTTSGSSAIPETQGSVPTTIPAASSQTSAGTVDYPSDTDSWQMICLNKNRYVDSSYENSLSLSYVAGSSEQMDSRAAAAYEKMYSAAASSGIYLTPCSGYRSYSTQKRLFNEFVDEYLAQGYSREKAYNLTSTRRNPPGSSEHNIGICMDIICASSSAGFENTSAYAWLMNNASDYGFILRYPADKANITGVKFEPWHWRYVGVENAEKIKNSGLCLEEYLGLA